MKFYSRRFLVTIFLSYLVISVFGQSVQQSLQKRIDDFFVATPQERIMLITDKDIYSPGEIIWFAAFSYEMLSPKLLTLSNNMNLNLISADNAHIATVSCAMKDGMAQGTIQLPDAVPEGVYILQPESLNSTTTANYHKKIGINRNVLPAFAIKAQFIDKSYFPGDQLDMTVGFTDIYNEIKKNVEYKIRYFDGDEEISSSSGKVKKEGVFHSSLQIPASLHTGVISYEIAAESKGRQEMLRGIVPVMSDQIHLFLYPENGKLFDGLKSEVHLYAHDALAKPISVTGVLHLGDEQEIEISTGSNGIGKFTFTPELGKDYFIKLQSPMTLEKKYTLPTVHPKGISLQVVDRNEHSVKYKLTNGYVDSRFFYLAGLNEGNLFWLSEHEIQDTLFVEVSTTKARGMIQMAVINAAVRLEGQHVFYKNEKQNIEVDYALDNVDPKKRSKVSLALNAPNQKGYAILKVANLPWMQNEIDDCEFEFLKFPFDITHEPFTFNVSLAEDAFAEVSKVYSPDQFGWDKILNTSGCFDQYTISEQVYKNLLKADKIKLQMDEQRLDGKMLHTNVLTDSYFATSNPGYYSVLHSAVRHVRVPPYKRMLQNGTPILEVLQTLKPYSIQGDGNESTLLG